eukprot:4093720-Prymnesium_polylepis.2
MRRSVARGRRRQNARSGCSSCGRGRPASRVSCTARTSSSPRRWSRGMSCAGGCGRWGWCTEAWDGECCGLARCTEANRAVCTEANGAAVH